MSDHHPKSEADQVLESVKRLVSAAPHRVAHEPAKPEPRVGERLLLTPSLRVEEANDDMPLSEEAVHAPLQETAPSPPAADPPQDVHEDEAMTAEGHSLEDRIAELEAAVSTQSDEFEPDGSELIDRETPRRFVFQHTPIDVPMTPPPNTRQSLADRFEDVEVVEAAIAAEPGPAPSFVPDTPAVAEDDPIPLRADTRPENAFDPTPDEAPVEPEPESATTDTADQNRLDVAEDVEIDEDMLRDIVAEIVRSELQGELGERITRNVRKLVRREIHRAIMTRDFS